VRLVIIGSQWSVMFDFDSTYLLEGSDEEVIMVRRATTGEGSS
jgi:hypothetical protein